MSTQDLSKKSNSINPICTTIKFSGEGCIEFLNNLLLSDLNKFNFNQMYYSALCNPKGRIISSLFISIKGTKEVTIICPENIGEYLVHFFSLRKFRLKFTISLNENSNLDNISSNLFLQTILTNTQEEFYSNLFENNLPWIDANFSEKFIPQHVNLDQHKDILSFTKGCYPGQEIIARLKYLGKIKKRMQLKTSTSAEELKLIKNTVSPTIKTSPAHFQLQAIFGNIEASDSKGVN